MFSVPSGVNAEPLRPPRVGATQSNRSTPRSTAQRDPRETDAHKITGQCSGQPSLEHFDGLVHLVFRFADG